MEEKEVLNNTANSKGDGDSKVLHKEACVEGEGYVTQIEPRQEE